MGFIVRFASRPVLSGFTSASAILTIASVSKVRFVGRIRRWLSFVSALFDRFRRTFSELRCLEVKSYTTTWSISQKVFFSRGAVSMSRCPSQSSHTVVAALPLAHWPTVITAAIALALLSALPRYRWTAKVPAPLQVRLWASQQVPHMWNLLLCWWLGCCAVRCDLSDLEHRCWLA